MKALADAYLADAAAHVKFPDGTGGHGAHHAWIGGLLEHTSTLLKLDDQMLPLYPQLSRDVVLLGLFIHDLDKTTELTWEKGFEYTAEGNLIGHLAAGATRLELMAKEESGISDAARERGVPPQAHRVGVAAHFVVPSQPSRARRGQAAFNPGSHLCSHVGQPRRPNHVVFDVGRSRA